MSNPLLNISTESRSRVEQNLLSRVLRALHLDGPLLIGILGVLLFSLLALYSAEGQQIRELLDQIVRMLLAFGALLFMAQINPVWLRRGAPFIYALGAAAADPGACHRRDRQGRTALARHRHTLPALGNHETRRSPAALLAAA